MTSDLTEVGRGRGAQSAPLVPVEAGDLTRAMHLTLSERNMCAVSRLHSLKKSGLPRTSHAD